MKKLQQIPLVLKRSQAFHKQFKNSYFKYLDTPIFEETKRHPTHSVKLAAQTNSGKQLTYNSKNIFNFISCFLTRDIFQVCDYDKRGAYTLLLASLEQGPTSSLSLPI